MAIITLRNPATGEQQAIEGAGYVTPIDETDAFYGWDKIADGLPIADLQVARRAQIDARLAEAFAGGFTPSSGPLAGHTLQVRDNSDRTNWLTSQAAYSAEVAGGNGAAIEAMFRDAVNATVTVSYAEGLDALLAMAAWGKALFEHSWSLKDQVAAAVDQAALDAIDIEAGWPS